MADLLSQRVEELLILEGFKIDKIQPMLPATTIDEDEATTFRVVVKGQHAEWVCMIRCFDETARILVYSLFPDSISEVLKPRMSELICRINYGLILGNFEMDWSDGELRYKTSMDVEDIAINQTILRNLVYGNFHSFDLYYSAIVQAINTNRDLDIIVMEVENPDMPSGFDLVDEIVH